MIANPDIEWEFADTTDAFAIDLRPASDPSRFACVVVLLTLVHPLHTTGGRVVQSVAVAVTKVSSWIVASNDGSYARMFKRHAHPFSAWSRLLSTPLLLVPLWTRRWWLYAPIGAWFAVNPVMTPPAQDLSSFATQAILGEESWSHDPTSEPTVLALTGVTSASLVGAMVAAYHHRKIGAVAGTAVFMALTLWEWRLFAGRFARETRRPAG